MSLTCKNDQELTKKECYRCITKCKPDQERNPTTGRCVKKRAEKSTTTKKCKPDQEINPKTGRCIKKRAEKTTTRKKRVYKKVSSKSRSRTPSHRTSRSPPKKSPSPILNRTSRSPPKKSPSPILNSVLSDPSNYITFKFRDQIYKVNKEDAEIETILIKNDKSGSEEEVKKDAEIYKFIYDMNMEDVVLKVVLVDYDDYEESAISKVIHMDDKFYFVDKEEYLYDEDGNKIGEYHYAGIGRGKGAKGMGKGGHKSYIKFYSDTESNNPSYKGESYRSES